MNVQTQQLQCHQIQVSRTFLVRTVIYLSELRQRLHERGLICNRIAFDAVTPSVYTTPVETITETGSIWKRWQKWSVLKTIRFHLSCKRRNRIDLNTLTILSRNFTWARRFKVVNLDRFTDFVLVSYFQTFNRSSTSSSVHVNCALFFVKAKWPRNNRTQIPFLNNECLGTRSA